MTSGKRSAVLALVLVTAGIGAARLPLSAQAVRTDDLLPALLLEMKGLRVAMEQMASGGPQAQLLTGRLQVQETRLSSMIGRLQIVRDDLDAARTEYDSARDSVQMFDKEVAAGTLSHADGDDVMSETKARLRAAKTRVERLAAEETELTADIAVEQQRWIAINQRLDELERTLGKR